MRFSRRTEWNTEESGLARAHRERVNAGLAIADLTASNPTRCGFKYVGALLAALTDVRALDYDPQPLGLRSAREAVCGYYADHYVAVSADRVLLTTSTSEAYSFLFKLLSNPDDEIVAPQPGYPLFDFLAVLDDVRIKAATLVYDEGWQIEPEGFRRAITPRTRAIVLVHPNNPTGHFTKAWEQVELAAMCRKHGIPLIVDEVFLDYGFDGAKAASFAAGLEGVDVYVVSGLSKIAGLPQMKAAWVVASGPHAAEAMGRLEVRHDFIDECTGAGSDSDLDRGKASDPAADTRAGGYQPGGVGSSAWGGGSLASARGGGRVVCGASDSGASARRANSAGVAGAGSLGASGILLRDGGEWLAGSEPAGPC